MPESTIRTYRPADLPAVKGIIDAVELFPSEMLDEMVPGEEDGEGDPGFWLTGEIDEPVAVACCEPERMTAGTWNLLLIAVHPSHQDRGIGAKLMRYVETRLAERGERVLLVETSGTAAFERTRGFYRRLGYEEAARIREYYDVGDDKVVFRKAL